MPITQIRQRQIADSAINDAKVQAGANIATSKLSDGLNFILRDGSVAFTGSPNFGNQRGLNIGTPTAGSDAANKSYVDTQIAALNSVFDFKGSVRAATTVNINLANPGTAIFDDVTLITGDRLLDKNQTLAQDNGIYIFDTPTTPLTRAADMDIWAEVPGAVVVVEEGTTLADTLWLCTANQGGILGTTVMPWVQLNVTGGSGLTEANFANKEVPVGAIDGVNADFTLANTPTAGTEHVYLNGFLQDVGAGNDYTITGAVITMATAPLAGEKIRVSYRIP